MPDQIVEITQPGYWLSKSRGFLEVQSSNENQVNGKIPLDDILSVIISTPGCSLSTVLIDYLSRRNIPITICGTNYLPTTLILPIAGYGRQFQVMQSQTSLSEPRRKRAWQTIVRSKIQNQADLLDFSGKNSMRLKRLISNVKSGDTDNCEAQAARIYWQDLFGKDFRRDRTASDLNTPLNYIYTVIRACIARGISSAGLHPTFSIHHKNPQNAFNLADDLVEPYRPIADCFIWKKCFKKFDQLNSETKTALASIVNLQIPIGDEVSPLSLAAVKTCRSYANYCLNESTNILLPKLPMPLEIGAL